MMETLEHKRLIDAGKVELAERLNEAIAVADFKLEQSLTDVETLVLEMNQASLTQTCQLLRVGNEQLLKDYCEAKPYRMHVTVNGA